MDGFASRPGDWAEVRKEVRNIQTAIKCMRCAATDTTLDVHHIVYLSNHGTNQQSNLITIAENAMRQNTNERLTSKKQNWKLNQS